MTLEDRLRAQGTHVSGTFSVQNCFDIMAMLYSRRCGDAVFTITAIPKTEDEMEVKEVRA